MSDPTPPQKKIHEIYQTQTNQSTELLGKVPQRVVDSSLSDVVESVNLLDNLCQFRDPKCKTKVSLIGFPCKLCKFTYCVKHNLPEVHGCGEMCKLQEQKAFKAKSKPEEKAKKKRQDMQKSLSSKLDKLQLDRKAKPGSSSKKWFRVNPIHFIYILYD